MKNLKKRTITGIIFIAVIIGAVCLSPITFFILLLTVNLLSLKEFYSIFNSNGIRPQKYYGTFLGSVLFIFAAYISQQYLKFSFSTDLSIIFKAPVIILMLSMLVFYNELFRNSEFPFQNIGITLSGLFYITIPLSLFCIIGLNKTTGDNYNPEIVLGILFILWTNDTFAYLTGSRFGKRKLFPRISPGKTWEGTLGGAVAALILALVLSKFYVTLQPVHWIVLSLIIAATGTLGDLTESMLKRSLQLKDSGKLFPGHGGLLDRFDGLFGSAPFVYCYLYLIEKI